MMLDQLKIYVMGDNGAVSVFRPASPIVLSAFVYNAKRMGSVSLTATVKDWECLDSLWTGREFVVLDEGSLSGGVESLSAVELGSVEKFFLLHTPSSSKSNVDERYVHTLEFTSERDVTLSNVYFYDAVDPNAEVDRYRSNTFEFSFFGTLSEFVGRYNSVLARRGLGSRFSVVIDAGTDVSVMKEVSFDRKTLFEALKAAYEAYEVPFWFEGDVIHFGGGSAEVPDVVFEYGMERELLSVSRNNAGELAVTRCTGLGGETNIPYYYPNPTPKGTLGVGGTATGVSVADQLKFASRVALDDVLTFTGEPSSSGVESLVVDGVSQGDVDGAVVGPFNASSYGPNMEGGTKFRVPVSFTLRVFVDAPGIDTTSVRVTLAPTFTDSTSTSRANLVDVAQLEIDGISFEIVSASVVFGEGEELEPECRHGSTKTVSQGPGAPSLEIPTSWDILFPARSHDTYDIYISGYVWSTGATEISYARWDNYGDPVQYVRGDITTTMTLPTTLYVDQSTARGWVSSSGRTFWPLSQAGLAISGTPSVGDTITQVVLSKITPSPCLLPPIYRTSGGADRWYPALNNTYPGYTFINEYDPLAPREYIEEFEDIYPTIRGTEVNFLAGVAFDDGFNTSDMAANGTDHKYNHFFVRLRPLGFNLFDCAIEGSDMVLEMVSGNCSGGKFKIQVRKGTNRNPVRVDANGDLVKDVNTGRVRMDADQDVQNDTTSNYVWICLRLDDSTFGDADEAIIPNENVQPVTGDEFVLTGISLPQMYFTAAEERLKTAILDFMLEHNAEKYSYTIKFSRIYLADNPAVRAAISEHASLRLHYGRWRESPGETLAFPLHVIDYTLRQTEGEPLPEIDVELAETVESTGGGLSQRIASAVSDLVGAGAGTGVSQTALDARYLRRDTPETVAYPMSFVGGWRSEGAQEGLLGGILALDADGRASIEIDRLTVRDTVVLPSAAPGGTGADLLEVVEYDTTNHKYAVRVKPEYASARGSVDIDGFYSEGFVSAGGLNAQGGGAGTAFEWEQLQESGTKIAVLTLNPGTQDEEVIDVYAPVGGSGGGGTVTSVAGAAASGSHLTVQGGPITGAGTLTVGVADGYAIPSSSQITAWTAKQDALTAGTDYLTPQTIANLYQTKLTEGSDYLSSTHVSDRIASYIVQATGQNTDKVMSQKAVTDFVSAIPAYGITAADIQSWNAKVSNVQSDWNATSGPEAILHKPTLATVATSGLYSDLSGAPSIPTESTVAGWGFTKNAGTITGIRMNGASKGTSGVVDLGTVLTEHQSLAGYQTLLSPGNRLNPAYIATDSTHKWWTDALETTLNGKAADTAVVHNSGNESISGWKTFSGGIEVESWSAITNRDGDDLDTALGDLASDVQALSTALAGKQNTLTFDTAPTSGSQNPVTSGGIYAAFQERDDAIYTVDEDLQALSASLSRVATSGSYNDLSDRPTIPAAQIQSDWNQTNTSAKDFIKNKPVADVDYVTPETLMGELALYQPLLQALGSATRPVYVSAEGTLTQSTTYAGGTKVTLNGSAKGGSTASFYAPTGTGTAGQYLVSTGATTKVPAWTTPGSVASGVDALVTGGTVYDYIEGIRKLDLAPVSSLSASTDLNTLVPDRLAFTYYAYVLQNGTTAGTNGFPSVNNANGLLTVGTYYGDAQNNNECQIGFSSNGNLYYRYISRYVSEGVPHQSYGQWYRLITADINNYTTIDALVVSGHTSISGNLYPSSSTPANQTIGDSSHIWGSIYANRWYPSADPYTYIEFKNGHFEVRGTLVAIGDVVASPTA